MAHRKKYLLYYNALNEKEINFTQELVDLITKYPIIWNNYLENIISKRLLILCDEKIIIHYLNIDEKDKNIIERIYNLVKKNDFIKKEIVKSEFVILYINSEFVRNMISNRTFWVKILIANICSEFSPFVYLDCMVKFENENIIQNDVVLKYNDYLFIINRYDKHNEINLKNEYSKYIVPIYYKSRTDKTMLRRNIISYSFDYENLKYNLKKIINKKTN